MLESIPYILLIILLFLLLAVFLSKYTRRPPFLHRIKKYLGMHSHLPAKTKPPHIQHNHKKHPEQVNHSLYTTDNTLTGTLIEYATNPIGDIDTLIVNTGNETVALHFPPHVGRSITQILTKKESTEFIIHSSRKKWFNQYPLYNLTAIKSAGSFLNIEDIKPIPPTGIPIELNGFISDINYNKDHYISSFIINNYLVDIPPHFGETITPVVNKDQEIIIRGYIRNKNTDFINKSGYDIIRPYAFSINNTNYLL